MDVRDGAALGCAELLARTPAVVVHTESGDEVVIVEGSAAPVIPASGGSPLIADAFAKKYEGYEPDPSDWESGALFLVQPRVVFALAGHADCYLLAVRLKGHGERSVGSTACE